MLKNMIDDIENATLITVAVSGKKIDASFNLENNEIYYHDDMLTIGDADQMFSIKNISSYKIIKDEDDCEYAIELGDDNEIYLSCYGR